MTFTARAWCAACRGIATVAVLVPVSLLVAACGGGSGSSAGSVPSATRPPSATSTASSSTTSSPAARSVAVSDPSGSSFLVKVSPVSSVLYVDANSFLWSSAPGQDFLTATLTVTNTSNANVEDLSDFDDLTSGLSRDVDFVVSATDAATIGYSSDCGVDARYPPSLCPVSLGQGLTVDSDSADHDDHSTVPLSPGASAQIVLSYGPVPGTFKPSSVALYFDNGQSAPVDLTP